MRSAEIFLALGYENPEYSNSKIVFVKYDPQYTSFPKYKRPCRKIIFKLDLKTLSCRKRNEKGNSVDFPIGIDELRAIHQMCVEVGWISNGN